MTIYAMNSMFTYLPHVYGHNNETLNINLSRKYVIQIQIKIKYRKMHVLD